MMFPFDSPFDDMRVPPSFTMPVAEGTVVATVHDGFGIFGRIDFGAEDGLRCRMMVRDAQHRVVGESAFDLPAGATADRVRSLMRENAGAIIATDGCGTAHDETERGLSPRSTDESAWSALMSYATRERETRASMSRFEGTDAEAARVAAADQIAASRRDNAASLSSGTSGVSSSYARLRGLGPCQ